MEVVYLEYPHDVSKVEIKETALALGYFDGVHKGHQQVISTAKKVAKEFGYQSGVMTFHPHPSVVLNRSNQHVQYITPLEDKIDQIAKLDIDVVYVVKFNEELAKLEPEEFVNVFLIGLNVKHVVAGFDFSYGRMGKGNMDSMKDHAKGEFTQTTIQKVTDQDQKISSTLIRKKLQKAEMQDVQHLLGRPFQLKGKVIKGDQRGRTIGFPTANIAFGDEYLLPKVGVYAVGVEVKNQYYYGMANIGYKPTFNKDEEKPTLEVYIFDFSGNIYDEELKLELFSYIRGEKKFSGLEELKSQLRKDEEQIRHFFSTSSR
ncbi:riboflavin biosynthesis protein RibF [Salirhabdus euzebyi]|uniref:riboflavin biosynthesis protein RibF n=1 Tax=Salirhabdus euzebyi TaxID=394506 RepID=UPI00157AE4CB|nr:riboflavin biosynthesis protein RibF [Salirhabdus euzebyi]